jgi:hypothetical protein
MTIGSNYEKALNQEEELFSDKNPNTIKCLKNSLKKTSRKDSFESLSPRKPHHSFLSQRKMDKLD